MISRLLGDGVLPPTDPAAFAVKVPDAAVAADVLGALSRANIQFTDFSLGAPSLDDVFFALTGRPAEETGKSNETARRPARSANAHERRRHPRRERQPLVMRAAAQAGLGAVGRRHAGLAGDAEDQTRPVPAVRRDHHADHVHAAVHVHLRRRAGRDRRGPTSSSCCRGSWCRPSSSSPSTRASASTPTSRRACYDRFRSLPMWQPAPILGALAGDLFRYSVASLLIIVLGLILGFRPGGRRRGRAAGVRAGAGLLLRACRGSGSSSA